MSEQIVTLDRVVQYTNNEAERERLEATHGQVWDLGQVQKDFEVLGFSKYYLNVQRRADGKKGALHFQTNPLFYFQFNED